MKQFIALSRLIGLITLILFLVLTMLDYKFAARVSIIISIACFTVIILVQLYRFYIQGYTKE